MSTTAHGTPRSRTGLWAVLAAAVLAAAIATTAIVQAERERDVQVDELYCTLPGVGLFDRGPKTGRLCFDLLGD